MHPFHDAGRQQARETFFGEGKEEEGSVSSYGDHKECSWRPPAALVDWWGLRLDLSPNGFVTVSKIQNVNWNTRKMGNAGAFLKLKVPHSPTLEWARGIAGCSEPPRARTTIKNSFSSQKLKWSFLRKYIIPDGGKIPKFWLMSRLLGNMLSQIMSPSCDVA